MVRPAARPALFCAGVTALPLRALAGRAARTVAPGWTMRAATRAFTAGHAAAQLAGAFGSVSCVRPDREAPVAIRDAVAAAECVASWAGFCQDQVARPWAEIVADVHQQVQAVTDREGAFTVSGDLAAFVYR